MDDSHKGLRKGTWTAEEDSLLRKCIDKYGEGKWHLVPVRAGLNRCRKSCRLRWLNYLKPSIKRGKLSNDEVDLLLRLHKLLGNRWSLIAGRLPNRTANDIKNYWNTHLSKKHELCCKTKIIKKKVVSAPSTTPAQKIDVLKPRPRSFSDCSHLNFLPEVEVDASWLGLNNNNVCESSITCKKDEEKDKLINDIMNGDNMWWESMLNESQEAGVSISEAMVSEKEATLAFDVEQLWSLFDEETVKLN